MYFKVKEGKENSQNDLIEYIPPCRIRIEHIDDSYTLRDVAQYNSSLLYSVRQQMYHYDSLSSFYTLTLRELPRFTFPYNTITANHR